MWWVWDAGHTAMPLLLKGLSVGNSCKGPCGPQDCALVLWPAEHCCPSVSLALSSSGEVLCLLPLFSCHWRVTPLTKALLFEHIQNVNSKKTWHPVKESFFCYNQPQLIKGEWNKITSAWKKNAVSDPYHPLPKLCFGSWGRDWVSHFCPFSPLKILKIQKGKVSVL